MKGQELPLKWWMQREQYLCGKHSWEEAGDVTKKKKSQDKESGYAGDSAALPDPGRQVPVSVLPLDHCNVSVLKEQRTQGARSQNLKQSSS